MFKKKPDYRKLSTNLKLSKERLKLHEKKKTENGMKTRVEIAEYLKKDKLTKAIIKVEKIIKDDLMVEGMELVEMFCEKMLSSISHFQTNNSAGHLEEAVASTIWSLPILSSEIKELRGVVEQLERKFGKKFKNTCQCNLFGNVNQTLIAKLSTKPPSKRLVDNYLREIAKCYNVPYTPMLFYKDEVPQNNPVTKRMSLDLNQKSFVNNRISSVPNTPSSPPLRKNSFKLPDLPQNYMGQSTNSLTALQELECRLKLLRTTKP